MSKSRDSADSEFPAYRDTPYGILYRPRSAWIQIPILLATLAACIPLGRGVGLSLGGLSDNAQVFLYVPFLLVLFGGYSLWMARLQAMAFDLVGRGLFKALFILIVRRRKPENLEELIPTPEKLERMAVRAQQASSAFWIVAIPIGILASIAALLIRSDAGPVMRAFSVGSGCIVWGILLAFLARRGYLPILEDA